MHPALLLLALAATTRAEAPAPPGSPAALRADVTFLAELDPPRSAAHPASLDRAAAHVAAELAAAGGRVEEQMFEADGRTYRNVRAFFGPTDGPRLVVGAHYDVCGAQPGADDNASGVAVLLALAHELDGATLAAPVELVAYSLEEPPNFATRDMGSAHHARALAAEGVELLGMLSLEMLGYYDDRPGSQRFPLPGLAERYPDTGDFVAVVGRPKDSALVGRVHAAMADATELGVEQLVAPGLLPGVGLSDHRNYWMVGYEAVMVTDTAFYRNPHYHEPTDTPDTLDYRRMAQAARAVTAAVLELAGE